LNALLLQNQPPPSIEGRAPLISSRKALTAGFF
jgi:hypothetical protein